MAMLRHLLIGLCLVALVVLVVCPLLPGLLPRQVCLDILFLDAVLVLVGPYNLFTQYPIEHLAPKRFIFRGLLTVGAGALTCICAWAFWPATPATPQTKPKDLVAIVDVSEAVFFPDDNEHRLGEHLFDRNALAKTIQQICQRLDEVAGNAPASGGDANGGSRPGLLQWLKQYWRLLLNWEPAKCEEPPAFQRPSDCRLYFFDGETCWLQQGGATFAGEIVRLSHARQWPPYRREKSAKSELKDVLRMAEENSALVLIATADVDGPASLGPWRECRPGPDAASVSILLPSLPRSAYRPSKDGTPFRGSAAKAMLLAMATKKVVCLEPSARLLPGVSTIDFFKFPEGLPKLDGADSSWDQPRDLDRRRREYFGPERATEVEEAVQRGVLRELGPFLPLPRQLSQTGQRMETSGRLKWVALVMVPWLLLAFALVPPRTISMVVNAPVPGPLARCACVVLLVPVVLGTVLAVSRFWPSAQWRQNGLPAMAVWGATATWAVLALWPILHRLYRSDGNCWIPGAFVVAIVVLPPCVGLLQDCHNVPRHLLVLGCPLLCALACLCHKSDIAAPEGTNIGEGRRWATALRWVPTASCAAAWTGLLLVGANSANETAEQYFTRLGLLLLLTLTVLFLLAWQPTPRTMSKQTIAPDNHGKDMGHVVS